MRKLIFFEGMKKNLSLLMVGIIMFLFSKEAVNAQVYRDRDSDGLIEISFIETLDSIRFNLTGACSPGNCTGYELTKSLDFSSASSYRSGSVSTSYTTGSGWTPIGDNSTDTDATRFNTTFEGNGYTIDHLFISRISANFQGLFGYTQSNSRIRNIGITNVSVSVENYGGALVGWNGGTIIQSYATVSVTGRSSTVGGLVGGSTGTIIQSYATGSVEGYEEVGGLVGINYGTISQSYATASVTGFSSDVGGLVGKNSNGTITQTYATGRVTSTTSNVGGLVGGSSGTITQSYAMGNITGTYDNIGGLVGYNSGTITQSYAMGNITGGYDYIGGLVGYNSGTITQTYATGATGSVYGSIYVGGLVGGSSGTITHGYWNKDASGTVGIGTGSGAFVSGLTLSDLKSPTATAIDSIRELGPGFLYYKGKLPRIHTGARVTVDTVHFTQTVPRITNIISSSAVANITQGTATTRATLTIDGFVFTANVIDTTSGRLKSPYTLTNIQNGTLKYSHMITFTSLGNKTYRDAPFVVSATSSAGLKVLFSASSILVSINNNDTTATIRGAGTVNITAYSENDTLSFASQTQILTISKASQSINFVALASKTFGDASFVLSPTSSAGLSVSYFASNTLVSININTVTTLRGAGTVSITAYQTGNDNYLQTSATQILTINKARQNIIFGKIRPVRIDSLTGDKIFSLNTSFTGYGDNIIPYTLSSSDTTVAKAWFNNDTKTGVAKIKKVGIANITAYQPDTANVFSIPITQPLVIKDKRKDQVLTFLLPNDIYMSDTLLMDVESSANLPIEYNLLNNTNKAGSTIAKIDTVGVDKIIILDTGHLKIAAFCKQTDTYNAVLVLKERKIKKVYSVNGKVTNDRGNPVQGTVIITQKGGLGQTKTVSLDAKGEFIAPRMREGVIFYLQNIPILSDTGKYFVTYYGSKKAIVWKEADTVFLNENKTGLNWVMQNKKTTSVGKGSCTIKGGVYLDTTQHASRITRSGRLPRARRTSKDRTVYIKPAGNRRTTAEEGNIVATVITDANGAFTFPDLPIGRYELIIDIPGASLIKTVSGFINLTTAGMTVNIEDVVGLDGSITRFVDSVSLQTITFASLPTMIVGQSIVLSATSSSNLPIHYETSDEKIALIKGNTLTALSVGSVTITASQSGNVAYLPASASQNVKVVITIHPLTFVETSNNSIRIFPNPANDYITIQYDKTQKVSSVKVYDMTGKSYELKMSHDELGMKADIKNLPKGEYILVIYGERGEVLKTELLVFSY